MPDDNICRNGSAANRVSPDISVLGVTPKDAPGFENSDAGSESLKIGAEIYRPKRFDHVCLYWLMRKISGKTNEKLRHDWHWHMFLTRSKVRALISALSPS